MIAMPLFLMILLGISSLFLIIAQFLYKLGLKKGSKNSESNFKEKEKEIKNQALNQQRHVIKGKISEQLAPYFPDFPFRASECRFLGSPIDLVVFQGMDYGRVDNIILVDIKTNNSKLTPLQQSIAYAAQNKKVFWYTYHHNMNINQFQENQTFQSQYNPAQGEQMDDLINQIFSEPDRV